MKLICTMVVLFGMILFTRYSLFALTDCSMAIKSSKGAPSLSLAKVRVSKAAAACRKEKYTDTAENLEEIAKFNDLDEVKFALKGLKR
ncbi:MAG: hypothetical protein ACRCYP_01675 [Alphaproteobacteria bacterium]